MTLHKVKKKNPVRRKKVESSHTRKSS